MKRYKVEQLRNLIFWGHGGCGKTMLAEAMLFSTKAVDRFGKVDDGTSIMDYDPEEIKRKISIGASVAPVEYKDVKVNILDTPGFFDFVGEVKGAIRAAGCCLYCGLRRIRSGSRHREGLGLYPRAEVARVIVINKMDRENANFDGAVTALRQRFGTSIIPVQIPIGAADKFQGY